MKAKNKVVLMIVVILFLLLTIILIVVDFTEDKIIFNDEVLVEKDENEYMYLEANFSEVTNYGKFFSILTTVNNIYNFVNYDNYSGALNSLNKSYIETYGVNISNINNYIKFDDYFYNPSITDIKEAYIYDSVAIYYIEVKLVQDILNIPYDLCDKYFEYIAVFYDENSFNYAFMPITKEEYNKSSISTENTLFDISSIASNLNNSYTVNSVSDSRIVDLYFYNFNNMYIYEIEDYEDYIYGSKPDNYFTDDGNGVVAYYYSSVDDYLKIEDKYGFIYEYYIDSVLDYKVKIS